MSKVESFISIMLCVISLIILITFSIITNKETERYSIICVDKHEYYVSTNGNMANKLNNDGTPSQCKGD